MKSGFAHDQALARGLKLHAALEPSGFRQIVQGDESLPYGNPAIGVWAAVGHVVSIRNKRKVPRNQKYPWLVGGKLMRATFQGSAEGQG
jgi:hypothetical protein